MGVLYRTFVLIAQQTRVFSRWLLQMRGDFGVVLHDGAPDIGWFHSHGKGLIDGLATELGHNEIFRVRRRPIGAEVFRHAPAEFSDAHTWC